MKCDSFQKLTPIIFCLKLGGSAIGIDGGGRINVPVSMTSAFADEGQRDVKFVDKGNVARVVRHFRDGKSGRVKSG